MTWHLSDFAGIAFEFILFALLLIKSYTLSKAYLIPLLCEWRDSYSKHISDLETQNAVLIHKKKDLATQFLNQEKRLILLSSKLEVWYAAALKRHKEKEEHMKRQSEKFITRTEIQDKNVQIKKAQKKVIHQVLSELKHELSSPGNTAKRERFLHDAVMRLKGN